ncbi:alpha/beta hydrolase [Pseudoxanthomonas sp. JBR18]|uniref:alpha/beta fold hydrolase n=1 Tax=Pseudoxanthomonas sp. JBR18 TaxID=2969308 RepID=UPI0023050790|nr:alpha/beta hydrolase [Pseudoxanthomonas sp. JBR18]WCE04701.1 alpha/beta hydrolase [Pseudoxanthomonas sp. JBR18]
MRNMLLALALATASLPTLAQQQPVYGARLEGFDYPYPVKLFKFQAQRQPLEMAYMDIAPTGPANGRTAVLLHGKNFCAATWEPNIGALSRAGYRVIAVDQVGFCKSSKPRHYQFSLSGLADNTHALLESLGIDHPVVIGHSMGGMLAIRYALMFPRDVSHLALVDPIGLEDWKAVGVPYQSVDQWYAGTLKTDYESTKKYQMDVYYAGTWTPAYERWARMQAGMYAGDGKDINAWDQALTYDMVYNQPVVYELSDIKVLTTLFIGLKDRTAVGKGKAPPEIRATLGNYPVLGKRAAGAIPGATLVEFADLGHSPQVADPARFNAALLKALGQP